jgi:hypothetical protein
MNFRTPLQVTPSVHKISLQTPVLALGSCFAEVMGEKLLANKFSTQVNPFGVIFNPVSLAGLLESVLAGTPADPHGVVNTPDGWRHYDFHSRIAAASPEELLQLANHRIGQTGKFLQTAQWLLLTLGTSFVYRRPGTDRVAANCHKVPGKYFVRELLPPEAVFSSLSDTITQLTARYPMLKIVLTVSPVRHLKDTLPLNAVSKSILRVACHQLTEVHEHVQYFPAFEIMTDDLRDYRFYKADMIHPSEVAEAYIWQKFTEAFMDDPTRAFLQEWEKIRQAMAHRPFNVQAPAHQTFIRNTIARLNGLREMAAVEEEIAFLQAQLLPSGHTD